MRTITVPVVPLLERRLGGLFYGVLAIDIE